ncbi:hypothetical protein HPB52_023334 [Rhipicephalus sanguineus]|uniref:Uncharacterized protein n=1 Tax=Rhipicephalus sanguineus TaxID=34632 RepID=A0A9D4QDK3_RHISA|nr:hypothetical protein HPB52_023334 [Rhipicephalus sanguineus]
MFTTEEVRGSVFLFVTPSNSAERVGRLATHRRVSAARLTRVPYLRHAQRRSTPQKCKLRTPTCAICTGNHITGDRSCLKRIKPIRKQSAKPPKKPHKPAPRWFQSEEEESEWEYGRGGARKSRSRTRTPSKNRAAETGPPGQRHPKSTSQDNTNAQALPRSKPPGACPAHSNPQADARQRLDEDHGGERPDGTLTEDPAEIEATFYHHFESAFRKPDLGMASPEPALMKELRKSLSRLDVDEGSTLCGAASMEELRGAIGSMPPNSAPGADGLTAGLYATFLDILGDSLLAGCPLGPTLFVLSIDSLLSTLASDVHIRGLPLTGADDLRS